MIVVLKDKIGICRSINGMIRKKPQVFNWWIKRLKKTLENVDVVRIDHFRGLESYWSIPVDENSIPLKPKDGKWIKAP